jgi:hypothetical protein
MKFFACIFLPFILTFVFGAMPNSNVYACESNCCKKEVKTKETKQNCCSKDNENTQPCSEKKDCGGDCGQQGCHCPSAFFPVISTVFLVDLPVLPTFNAPLSKADWYFQNTIPSAVYLSIWLPPKIAV